MQAMLRERLKAGAIGLSTSYIDGDAKGRPVPSRYAQFSELDALAEVLGEFGRMLLVAPEFYDADLTIARIDQLAELSIKHDIPTTFSPVFDSPMTPHNVARQIARVEEQTARGARIHPQMQTRPVDVSFSLLRPSLLFARFPLWYRILRQPVEVRLASLRDLQTVEKLIADAGPNGGADMMGALQVRGCDAAPNALIGRTLASIAAGRGETPAGALTSLSAGARPGRGLPGLARGPQRYRADRPLPGPPPDAQRGQ
jgi:N-acyl-D-amino-acid deacylase